MMNGPIDASYKIDPNSDEMTPLSVPQAALNRTYPSASNRTSVDDGEASDYSGDGVTTIASIEAHNIVFDSASGSQNAHVGKTIHVGGQPVAIKAIATDGEGKKHLVVHRADGAMAYVTHLLQPDGSVMFRFATPGQSSSIQKESFTMSNKITPESILEAVQASKHKIGDKVSFTDTDGNKVTGTHGGHKTRGGWKYAVVHHDGGRSEVPPKDLHEAAGSREPRKGDTVQFTYKGETVTGLHVGRVDHLGGRAVKVVSQTHGTHYIQPKDLH